MALLHPHHHLDQLALGELERGDGHAELHPLAGVVERRLVAGPRRPGGSEQDAEAGLVQARQRPPQRGDPGQAQRLGEPDVGEHQLGGHRGPQRHLLVDVVGGEAGGVGGDDEARWTPSSARGPDDGHIGDAAVGDPHLGAVEDPVGRRRARARVRIEPGRSPNRARSARSSRRARRRPCGAATRCFCSSEPKRQIGNMASDPWTDTKLRAPESPASSSRHARP